MKILYLAHRIPYPPNKGDKIRTFNEIRYLSENNEIHLLALADDPSDLRFKHDLTKYCSKLKILPLVPRSAKIRSMIGLLGKQPLSVYYFYLKKMQKIVNGWLEKNKYDAVICFSSPMAEYVFRSTIDSSVGNPVLIMDYCDLDSRKWDQYAKQSRFPYRIIYRVEKRRLFEYEKKINKLFNHSVFVSENEVALFKSIYPLARNLSAIPNGVDDTYFSPKADFKILNLKQNDNHNIIVFTGAMDYYANIDGVTWFCNSILPGIKEKIPDVQFYIVGSHPASEVKDLAHIDGVHVTGFVNDIRPYYHEADVCVVPLRIAAGIQNKVLEAMSMEKPVVSTSRAFEGIQGIPQTHALIEDQAVKFANAVIYLLQTPREQVRIGHAGKILVRDKYSWNENISILNGLVKRQPYPEGITLE